MKNTIYGIELFSGHSWVPASGPCGYETKEQALQEIRDNRVSLICYRVVEYQPKDEVWIVEVFFECDGGWRRSSDFNEDYPSSKDAEAAYRKSKNGLRYRAVQKSEA